MTPGQRDGERNPSHSETFPLPDPLRAWLSQAVEAGASDLHLIVGYPPVLRLHGDLIELREPALAEETRELLCSLCPADALPRLQGDKNVDFSIDLAVNGQIVRFRANLFHAGGQLGACLRLVPDNIPSFDWAGFPPALARRLAGLRDGLVVVTGPTGSGKTTSLAMVVHLLNQT